MGHSLFARSSKCILIVLISASLYADTTYSDVAVIKAEPKMSEKLISLMRHRIIRRNGNSYLYFCRYKGDFIVSRFTLNWKHIKTYTFNVKHYSEQTPFNVSIGDKEIYILVYNRSYENRDLDKGELVTVKKDLKSHRLWHLDTGGLVDGRIDGRVFLYSYNVAYKGIKGSEIFPAGVFYDYRKNKVIKKVDFNYSGYVRTNAMGASWESDNPGNVYTLLRNTDGNMVMVEMNSNDGSIRTLADLSSQLDKDMISKIGWDDRLYHVLKDGRRTYHLSSNRSDKYLFCEIVIDPCDEIKKEEYLFSYNIETKKIRIIKNPLPEKPRFMESEAFDYIDGYLYINWSRNIYKTYVGNF